MDALRQPKVSFKVIKLRLNISVAALQTVEGEHAAQCYDSLTVFTDLK